ncbi:hypothetical protein VNO78_20199 [Psophocarpus tetragonolobus]|uniref:Uncharacterized protein n=1 Tax=Psophocarpus tetragonolobus TaxID=3891 RepID=A0AAN9XHA6_PSOTE
MYTRRVFEKKREGTTQQQVHTRAHKICEVVTGKEQNENGGIKRLTYAEVIGRGKQGGTSMVEEDVFSLGNLVEQDADMDIQTKWDPQIQNVGITQWDKNVAYDLEKKYNARKNSVEKSVQSGYLTCQGVSSLKNKSMEKQRITSLFNKTFTDYPKEVLKGKVV